jgi:hypothetical protein
MYVCVSVPAFICMQPTATGPNPTEPRWWFNSVTGMCQQFLWDPVASGSGEHSPNNFRTVEHCESFCRDGEWKRGDVQRIPQVQHVHVGVPSTMCERRSSRRTRSRDARKPPLVVPTMNARRLDPCNGVVRLSVRS